MKFRCERDELADALATAGRAVANRGGALPVLSGVLLHLADDRLEITGSDLDLTISVNIEVGGEEDGLVVLPARLASDVVRSVENGKVIFETDDEHARVTGGSAEFEIRLIPADEFPRLAQPEGDAVTIDAALFNAALKQVTPAASGDDSRPILTGVLLSAEEDGLRLVATDSYRLAVRTMPGTSVLNAGEKVLVPSRALNELSRVLPDTGEVTLQLGERDAAFEVEGTKLVTRLIEGDFPNYQGLIPSGQSNVLSVGRGPLLEALRRVKLLAREATPVRLVMKPDGPLELLAVTQDVGQAHDEVEAQFDGTELTVAFNPDYLLQGLEVCPGDELRIETLDALKPALIKSVEGTEFLYLLMPVRVS
jgi:DNA polymerase-3 subunit beta